MSNQLVITSGAKVRNLEGVLTGTSGVVNSLPINVSNGIPQLDSNGKILVSQLPNSVMEYKGTWNVVTNTPYLVNGVGNQGDVYLVEGAATTGTSHDFGAGAITFYNGDQAIYSGSIWQRASGATGSVSSVGLSTNGGAITISNSPITTSGVISANFNGTASQYVNGAGNLVTFPTTIAQAQRLITEVYNETGSTLTKGTVVYINGGHGNLPTVTKAIATGDATSAQTYGVVQNDITDNNNGYVVVIGSLGDLDTQSYAAGTQLYLSSTTAGAWTSTKQYAPAHLVYVGIVVRSHPTQGVVEVRIQNGFELDELHNVSAQTPSNNQGLFYNSSNQLWENKSIATALGYTPANQALVVPYTGATTDVDLGIYELQASLLKSTGIVESTLGILTSYGITLNKTGQSAGAGAGQMQMFAPTGTSSSISFQDGNSFYISRFNFDNTGNRTYTFPNASGTVALTSDIPSLAGYVTLATTQTITGAKTFSGYTTFTSTVELTSGLTFSNSGFTLLLQPPTLGVNRTVTLPNGTGTLALTSDIPSLSATAPISYSSGVISISQATTSTNGYLSSTDWNTFNGKQAQINGTGFVKASGTTISYDNSTYALDSAVVKLTGNQTIGGTKTFSTGTRYDGGILLNDSAGFGWTSGYIGLAATNYLSNKGLIVNFGSYLFNLYFNATTSYSYTFPNATGTLALTSDLTGGTVTSVAALTIGTSGTDLSSTVANSTTTPVITLNVPTASATNRGALSSTDWTTFNNKQNALTNPVTGTGTTNYLPKFTGTSTIGNSQVFDNGTNVGIGTATPSYKLDVNGAARINNLLWFTPSSGLMALGANGTNLEFYNGSGAETRLILTNTGNLGLGVTPSAWNLGGSPIFQLGNSGVHFFGAGTQAQLGSNAFYNGSNYIYVVNGNATRYIQNSTGGEHKWETAPSGTAGNAITFTQAMTLTAAGRLLINTPTESTYQLDVNGTGRFTSTLTANELKLTGDAAIQNTTTGAYIAIYGNTGGLYLGARNAGANQNYQFINASTGVSTFTVAGNDTRLANFSTVTYGSARGLRINSYQSSNGGQDCAVEFDSGVGGYGGFKLSNSGTPMLTLTATGAATFSSSVQSSNLLVNTTSNDGYISVNGNNSSRVFYGQGGSSFPSGNSLFRLDAGGATVFQILGSGAATFSSTLTTYGALYVGQTGVTNGIINSNDGMYFNIDADASGSTPEFMFGKGRSTAGGGGTTLFTIANSGAATFSSSVTATSFFESSDSRLKTLIQDNYQTKGIGQITPKLYTKNGKVELGYYAQDFIGILDNAISKGSDDMLSLSYREVHTAKIYALEQEIKELKAKLN